FKYCVEFVHILSLIGVHEFLRRSKACLRANGQCINKDSSNGVVLRQKTDKKNRVPFDCKGRGGFARW
ncbi:MAG TPA: hypothetical protein VLS48_01780, partial [Anaerolineales bacterium]|nr:hypothetical protein [Anaerolineales bacterium]